MRPAAEIQCRVMARKRPPRKVRVDFRQNRQVRRRQDDWTRRFRADEEKLDDTLRHESVRAKGDLSRKRTIILGDDDSPLVDRAACRPGTVTQVHGRTCTVHDGQGQTWECSIRRVLRTRLIETRSPVTVGDRVWFSDHAAECDGLPVGVIEHVAERTSWLSRRDFRQREHTIVANADQLLAVLSVVQPRLRPHLADRYIVAALKGGLRPILCFNKVDLAEDTSAAEDESQQATGQSVWDAIEEFRSLGYRCLCTSAVAGVGLAELRAALQDHMTVLAGQSGVGKSSLLNALQPGLGLKTREVSEETEKGRHTTTWAQLLPLDFGGYVVDTPGVRAFDVWGVKPGELEAFFEEFIPYVPQCQFSDCVHRQEEGCAVIAAVEAGAISPRRYASYLKLLAEV